MELLLALMLIWGSLQEAADEQARAEAIREAALVKLESERYRERTDDVLKSEWSIMPKTVDQGDAVLVRSSSPGSVRWLSKDVELLPYGKGYYAMLPVPTGLKPGTYPIGNETLTVKAKAFETQYLEVTEEQEQMWYNTERINRDQLRITRARSVSEPSFLYREPFLVPVEGELTTPYGYTRYVNGVFSGSHKAIDIAADTGVPVRTSNAGKVILSEEFYLTGLAVWIDHGMNVFTQYAHLSKLNVKEGDRVEAGQIIGEIGSTGFSTGPHLHFAFWIGHEPANPDLFFGKTPFQWR